MEFITRTTLLFFIMVTQSGTLPVDDGFGRSNNDLEFLSNQIDVFRRSGGKTIDQIIEDASHETNPNEVHSSQHGLVKVEGDILLPVDEYQSMIRANTNSRKKRKAVNVNWFHGRWPNGIVYYKYDNEFSSWKKHIIKGAMDEWKKYTCIDFQPATSSTPNYTLFVENRGCGSVLGIRGGEQNLSLAFGCENHGVIVHELGHAIGFDHEQSRTDRDNYITIHWENIPKTLGPRSQFFIYHESDYHGVPYDYRSVMHYGPKVFSRNNKPTITTKDPKYQDIIGNTTHLSFNDIKLANIIYSCNSNCPSKTCPDEGFVGKDCKCWCKGNPDDQNNIVVDCGASPGNCMDDTDGCGEWASYGFCKDPAHTPYMLNFCKKSCGVCSSGGDGSEHTTKTPSLVTTVTPSAGNCVDDDQWCGEWASYGFCKDDAHTGYMLVFCKKSCGVCSSG